MSEDKRPPTTDQFTDPATPKLTAAQKDKRLIQAGRYSLPDPVTGEPRLWTRASTLAKTLEDSYNLTEWQKRKVAKGLTFRPDLFEMAAALDVDADSRQFNDVTRQAKEAAGGSFGANMGTALHAWGERVDRGEDLSNVGMSPDSRATMDAYRREMQRHRLEALPELMERVVLCHELGIVGRLDRIVRDEISGRLLIGDLKSQKTMDFSNMAIAVQLAIYAHADYMLADEDSKTWAPIDMEIDRTTAIVMHIPVGKGTCDLHDIDLEDGWEAALLSIKARSTRNKKFSRLRPGPVVAAAGSVDWAQVIQETVTVAGLSSIWRDASAAGQWTPELQAMGLARKEEIER